MAPRVSGYRLVPSSALRQGLPGQRVERWVGKRARRAVEARQRVPPPPPQRRRPELQW